MRTRPSVQHVGGLRARRAGFTLLELMAVVTIILIVVGLLSVALNQTRTRTMRVTCLDNMRQLQIAWRIYADDNNDFVALNKMAAPGGTVGIAAAPRNSTNSWVAGNPKEDRTVDPLSHGTLFQYTRQAELYRCPMDSSTTRFGTPRTRSYSIDSYLGGDDEELDSRVKMRTTDLINPSPDRVFVFIEEHENSIWGSGFMVYPRDRSGQTAVMWNSIPSDRHMQGCNVTFADGHLEYWKWRTPKKGNFTNKPVSPKELPDLRKVQDSIPRP
jgi:prepilin-type N-terminal cleavage/methylation domain-containing protein/prepilin-type processing-associated H-X9-DG protein